ncbi:hypothetical protein HOO65_010441 [Ceratocystis lukuohia]|uniref:HD domain-containing protein n=1 Tax=Ceratocystis lukuohia TaxID=2019550 RepID=A0ABR4MS25_9PEZI
MSKALLTPVLRAELKQLYDAPGRPKYTLSHRDSLLEFLAEHRSAFNDPDAIEAVIWFHDAIHDPRAMDNEQKSAQLCAARLASVADRARVQRIIDMILAAGSNTLPKYPSKKHVKDAELFLDIDLHIFGASREKYLEYEDAMREEYAWAGEDAWVVGHGSSIRKFLDMPHVYRTKVMRDKYEKQAQENLRFSLNRLTELTAKLADKTNKADKADGESK